MIGRAKLNPRLWVPRHVTSQNTDTLPRCCRCSVRTGRSEAIECVNIEDAGDSWIEVVGRCRGRCEDPVGPPKIQNQKDWIDAVRISWANYSEAKSDDPRHKEALAKEIAQIRFFDNTEQRG